MQEAIGVLVASCILLIYSCLLHDACVAENIIRSMLREVCDRCGECIHARHRAIDTGGQELCSPEDADGHDRRRRADLS